MHSSSLLIYYCSDSQSGSKQQRYCIKRHALFKTETPKVFQSLSRWCIRFLQNVTMQTQLKP